MISSRFCSGLGRAVNCVDSPELPEADRPLDPADMLEPPRLPLPVPKRLPCCGVRLGATAGPSETAVARPRPCNMPSRTLAISAARRFRTGIDVDPALILAAFDRGRRSTVGPFDHVGTGEAIITAFMR